MNATITRIRRLTDDALPAGDGPLLDAFLAGDQSAFAALVRRHAGPVFATCRRILRHQQDAEDAFQAVFLVLARRAADVWPREAVGSWLFGVAHRVALKARAVRCRRLVREHPLEEVASAERPAPDFDLAEVVHRVVLKLPEVYRAAVVACDLEGLSRKEAAERLGWTEGTLSGRLARARELLGHRLRRLGLSLPAGGLATLATIESVSAAVVQTTIELATGPVGGVSAPVAALTEGVVRSMALFKLKAMTAVVFVACALGFGAFAAAGAGVGDGPEGQQKQLPGAPLVPLAVKPAEQPKPVVPPPAKPVTDRDRLQGTWRIVALTEGEKTTPTDPKDPWVIEITGYTLRMPYREIEGGWKQREYTFVVDDAKMPRTIDLLPEKGPIGRGLYEFIGSHALCSSCHKTPLAVEGWDTTRTDVWGLCGPALKDPLKMQHAGVRLALSIDGKRPAKFGGPGVIVFEMKRPADVEPEQVKAKDDLLKYRRLLAEKVAAAATAREKEKLEAELKALQQQIDELVVREAARKAVYELRQAQANLEGARVQAERAQADVALATVNLQRAKERLAAAEKALEDAKKAQPAPAKEGEVFTVHVRTLTAAEKVIRVKATGKETVLEGLVYAADDVAIKSDGVSVWVVRDKAVLPVDLPGITKNGESKTNYVLKAGDQLFVQAKAK